MFYSDKLEIKLEDILCDILKNTIWTSRDPNTKFNYEISSIQNIRVDRKSKRFYFFIFLVQNSMLRVITGFYNKQKFIFWRQILFRSQNMNL